MAVPMTLLNLVEQLREVDKELVGISVELGDWCAQRILWHVQDLAVGKSPWSPALVNLSLKPSMATGMCPQSKTGPHTKAPVGELLKASSSVPPRVRAQYTGPVFSSRVNLFSGGGGVASLCPHDGSHAPDSQTQGFSFAKPQLVIQLEQGEKPWVADVHRMRITTGMQAALCGSPVLSGSVRTLAGE
ncbi:hypothetical protein MG293_005457 [Ovis ammon polii]|uniref:Uncharacterized protein n=1 Tax=Ovis ammon polii TaxID=230172 RepID=A0AAD4UH78_OVIAM|nr:hypothetical protein MG293_005457 [Ovis ammon polii]